VIGTEADVPPVFAAAWAEAFFPRLLAGEPLAAAMHAVTRDFAEQHQNLLGLLYVLHCDGRTRIRPPVPTQAPHGAHTQAFSGGPDATSTARLRPGSPERPSA
jgi:hypothetical protein